MNTIFVNHVMSRNIKSKIFDSIINYHKEFCNKSIIHKQTKKAKWGYDIYHYHRVNFEKNIKNNSIVTVHHDLEDPGKMTSFDYFEKKYHQCRRIICLNNTQKNFLINSGLQEELIRVIPHGFNNKLIHKKQKTNTGERIKLGIISKFYDRKIKGEAYLLELAKRLPSSKFEFVLAGDRRNLTKRDLECLNFQCNFLKDMEYQKIQSFYENIDVLLMCSPYEGGPANIPEALATGTPVLSSKVGMSNDMIIENKNGIFLSLNAKKDIDIFYNLIDNIQELKENSLQIPFQPITWQEVVSKHDEIYKEVIREF